MQPMPQLLLLVRHLQVYLRRAGWEHLLLLLQWHQEWLLILHPTKDRKQMLEQHELLLQMLANTARAYASSRLSHSRNSKKEEKSAQWGTELCFRKAESKDTTHASAENLALGGVASLLLPPGQSVKDCEESKQ
jgi:hypothetical protein